MVFSKDCPFEGTLKRVFNTTLIGSLNIENLSDFKNVTFNYRITKKDSKDNVLVNIAISAGQFLSNRSNIKFDGMIEFIVEKKILTETNDVRGILIKNVNATIFELDHVPMKYVLEIVKS